MLNCGRIIYTNDLPIYAAFDEGAIAFPGTLHADVPASLNAMLKTGELDLSPISAFAFAREADAYTLLPQICIGSRGDVWSVILASPRPPAELDGATIAVTTESASGRNLLRVLLERRFGVRARFEEVDDVAAAAHAGVPTLLIGDKAIDEQFALPPDRVYDLGTLWHEWTGLDMVYAVWAVRNEVLATRREDVALVAQALVESAAWGCANLDRVVARAQAQRARPAGFYEAYYATLNFEFDDRARTGLARYVEELAAAGAIRAVPSLEPENLVRAG
jgi:chorismate dehydratase